MPHHNFNRAKLCVSAVDLLTVGRCPSVRPSHGVLYQNG